MPTAAAFISQSPPTGGRRWVFLFRWRGKPTEIEELGSARHVSLARARELAGQARTKLAEGGNPLNDRKKPSAPTFGECAGFAH